VIDFLRDRPEVDSAVSLSYMAKRLVFFFLERYPRPHRVKVACDLCNTDTPLLEIHRRDLGSDMRLGTADCDINPIAPKFVFLCGGCTERRDKKDGK
jgi:hypothetical protein